MGEIVLANLDCEVEWANAPPLPAAVRARIAALGTLLRIYGDVLLVGPVAPARIPAVAGVRGALHPEGVRGAVHRAWGATATWPESGSVEVARACNDRRLSASLGDSGDAYVVESIAALEQLLPELGGEWVAKATICAAGRDRVRRRGATIDDATRTRLGRLMARGGALVVEPWRRRVLDLGQPGVVESDGSVTLLPPHRLLVDDGGGFAGIAIGDDPEVTAHAERLARAGRAAGEAIAARGHRGEFVVDAFVHAGGLRAIVEINARLTFGHVARAWAAQLGAGALHLGRGAVPDGAIALLHPGAADDTSAWWATSSRR